MVINIGAVKSGNWDLIENEIEAIVQAAQNHVVKVILEAALLTNEEIRHACRCAKRAGAQFVKTSTGFGRS
jgi:deoxyribose-phosphate aldolase